VVVEVALHDCLEPCASLSHRIVHALTELLNLSQFAPLLKGNGEDVKVVQELLRHSTSRMTLYTYTQALGHDKRAAQSRVVGMIRPKTTCTVVVPRGTDQTRRKSRRTLILEWRAECCRLSSAPGNTLLAFSGCVCCMFVTVRARRGG